MPATLHCTLHRVTAKQAVPPPPPIVLTLQGGSVTERTEEFAEFKNAQASLGETVLSLKCAHATQPSAGVPFVPFIDGILPL